jgi:putative FmdB family regulatory protein
MPIYDFDCSECGEFRVMLPISHRNDPMRCPDCARPAVRLVMAPNLATMSPAVRKASAINERSRHEPRVRESHSCGSGCGCGTGKRIRPERKKDTKLGVLTGQKAGARPWMLGH